MMRLLLLAASMFLGCVDTRLPAEDTPPDRGRPDARLGDRGSIDRGSIDRGRRPDVGSMDQGADRGQPVDAMPLPDRAPPPPDRALPPPDAAPPQGPECLGSSDCRAGESCYALRCIPAELRCYCRLDDDDLVPGIECSFWGLDSHRDQIDPRDEQGRTYAETRDRYVARCLPSGPLATGTPCRSADECQEGLCLFTGTDPQRCSEECVDAPCPNGTQCLRFQTGIQLCAVLPD